MKKIFFILSLFLAVSTVSVAQEKKTVSLSKPSVEEKKLSPEVLAKKEVSILDEYLELTDNQVNDLFKLLVRKYQTLSDKELSQERKTIFNQACEAKVQATLTDEQKSRFESKKEEYNKVMNTLTQSK